MEDMGIGSGSIKSLKKLYQRKVGDDFDPEVIGAEMESESDRACVILIGSVLEDELLNLICGTLHLRDNLTSDESNAMFGPDGPLGSFSKKIAMAYAFSLIEKADRDQLTIIREMRNACAHIMGPISFETPQLAAVAKNLTHENNNPITPRDTLIKRPDSIYLRSGSMWLWIDGVEHEADDIFGVGV